MSLTAPSSPLQVQPEQPFQDLLIGQVYRPAVGGEDGGIQLLMRHVLPGRSLVIETGQRPLGQLHGAINVTRNKARVTGLFRSRARLAGERSAPTGRLWRRGTPAPPCKSTQADSASGYARYPVPGLPLLWQPLAPASAQEKGTSQSRWSGCSAGVFLAVFPASVPILHGYAIGGRRRNSRLSVRIQ